MKVLRSTFFSPQLDPVTTVVMEDSLLNPIEQVAQEMEETAAGAFVIVDIFDVPGSTNIIQATLAAEQRAVERRARERDMALTYYYDAGQFHLLNRGGVLTMTQPAPLSATELEVPLRQLARHPNYDGFTIVAISEDNEMIEMRRGEVRLVAA